MIHGWLPAVTMALSCAPVRVHEKQQPRKTMSPATRKRRNKSKAARKARKKARAR